MGRPLVVRQLASVFVSAMEEEQPSTSSVQ
jgi:hypothetical protein